MIDPNTAMYVLFPTVRTQAAVFSAVPNEKISVDVINSVYPYDVPVVFGWITEESGERFFTFDDGKLGRTVTMSHVDAVEQMIRPCRRPASRQG